MLTIGVGGIQPVIRFAEMPGDLHDAAAGRQSLIELNPLRPISGRYWHAKSRRYDRNAAG